MATMRRPIFSNFMALASTQLVGRAIRFLYLSVIARYLSLEDVGVFSYGVAAYIALSGIGMFGQDLLLATRVGRKPQMFRVVASHSLLLLATAVISVTTVGMVGLWCTESDQGNLVALSVLLMAIMARGVVGWVRSCFVSLEQATWIPRYEAAFRGVEAVTGTLALVLGAGLLAICFLHVAFWLVEAAVSWRLLAGVTGFAVTRRVRQKLLGRYAVASLMLMLSPWLLLAFPQIAIIGLRQMQADLALVAQFGIAMQFVMTLFIVPVALTQAMLPGVARSARARNDSDLLVVVTAVKICLILGVALASIGTAVGPELVPLMFGQPYAPAGNIFASLMWGLGPFAAAFVAVAALNGVGARKMATASATAMVICQITLMTLPRWITGIDPLMSVVGAFLAATAVGLLCAIIALNRALSIERRAWWLGPVGISLACAGLASSGLVPTVWVAILGCGMAAAGTVLPGAFSRGELSFAIRKSGLGRFGLVRRFLTGQD